MNFVMFISDTMLVRFLKLHVPDNFIILGASADEITNRWDSNLIVQHSGSKTSGGTGLTLSDKNREEKKFNKCFKT